MPSFYARALRARPLAIPFFFAVVACHKNEAPTNGTEPTSSASTSSASTDKVAGFDFAGTVAGKPTAFRSAVIATRPGSEVLHVLVSTHPRTCKDLEGGYGLTKGETVFRLALAPGLAPARPGEWFITDSYYDGSSSLGGRTVDVKVDGKDPTKSITLTLGKLTLDGMKKAAPIEAQGAIVARGCGVVAEKTTGPGAAGPSRPQADLTFKVGGAKLAVAGARYDARSNRIVLSTAPLSCTSSYSEADVSILLEPEGKMENLQGLRIGSFRGAAPAPKPKITLGKASGKEMSLAIDGAFTHEDWPVELRGKATLEVCD